MKKIILSIEGMTCSACSNGLEKYLLKQDGVESVVVNLVMATASVEFDDKLEVSDIEKFVKDAGFKSLGEANLLKEEKISKTPFIVYGILGLILMYISMGPMIGLKTFGIFDNLKVYSVTLLILVIPFIVFGRDILKSGIKNLIHKMPNMDTLVSIGFFSSFLYSVFNVLLVFMGHEHAVHNLYFEGSAFVLYFIKLGRFIDRSSKNKTKEAIKKLVTMTPKSARIKIGEEVREVTIDEVKKGDLIVSLPGEVISVDGVLVEGETHIDEAFITGESKPVSKVKGSKVLAGSINFDGNIVYRAERVGRESTISSIVRLVLDATNTKAPIALLADKISGYFVPIVIVLSVLTFIGNLIFVGDFTTALERFVTVLVVACPCALGLATPLAIVVSEGKCAKNGILVKSSEVFEIGSKIDTIVFDKTGILTEGKLMISSIFNYSDLKDEELLDILGSLEKNSIHPIAKGIINSINKKNINLSYNFKIEELAGFGIKGKNNKDIYYVCNSKLLRKLNISNLHMDQELKLAKTGCSIVYLVKNDEILGLFGINDILRKETSEVIDKLNKDYEVIMLTGDNNETANMIGKSLNIKNIISDCLPDEKGNVIKELKKDNKNVIMVGDGINDAVSLTLADIGISVNSGSDIANDTALVILMNNNLESIILLLNICKKTLINIKENLFWAFLYNVCMIPVAMGLFTKFNIEINPMIACIAMICSSLFVILNALRLRR